MEGDNGDANYEEEDDGFTSLSPPGTCVSGLLSQNSGTFVQFKKDVKWVIFNLNKQVEGLQMYII